MIPSSAEATRGSTANEHVILNATIMVTPAADQGLPIQLGPGRLLVTAQLTDSDVSAPTTFVLRADRDSDPAGHIEMPVSTSGESATVTLSGGVYAWNVHVNAPTPDNATLADVAHYAQFVTLHISFTPQ